MIVRCARTHARHDDQIIPARDLPLMQAIDLPQAAAVQRETKPNIVSITVDQDGKITYGMDKTPSELASSRVKEDLGKDPDSVFVIRGDRKASYESIAQVLDVLKASGAKHVSLASEAKSKS